MPWNYGDVIDVVGAAVAPDAPAFIHGAREVCWADAYARMNNLARAFAARGSRPGDKIAFLLRNVPEYTEAVGATFLGRFVHVNVNYRYKPEEIRYILDNSDAQTLIYASEFRDAVAQIRGLLPRLQTCVEVGEGEVADFAEAYEALAAEGDGAPLGIARSVEDMTFIYTGGTTGMPKGVMYHLGTLSEFWARRFEHLTGRKLSSLDDVAQMLAVRRAGLRGLPASPLMHGTGFLAAVSALLGGGCVVTVDNRSFDPHAVWAAVERHKVQTISIVGDPFARPLLQALDEAPGRYDLSSMASMTSSGAMWSMEVKRGLLHHIPQLTITDSFASTEAVGMGMAVTTREGGAVQTAKFQLLQDAIVIDENDVAIAPGSGKAGLVAVTGMLPVGYYKDPEKTAGVFRTIEGRRYSVPGDWARVEADGSITLLGRGSHCINTAGEKVFPEEVEEVLKTHPCVEDALVLGTPDDKWGQAVTGIVALAPGAAFDEEALRRHVRGQLAGYKTPKRIFVADVPLRAPNGKADYKRAGEAVRAALALGN